jgi:hypothetical protein
MELVLKRLIAIKEELDHASKIETFKQAAIFSALAKTAELIEDIEAGLELARENENVKV